MLRGALAIRETKQPDLWSTFDTRSALGGALLGQKKYAEAEPLLLQGFEGMKQREAKIRPVDRRHLVEALERLVRLYEETDDKEKAEKYRALLDEARKMTAKLRRG